MAHLNKQQYEYRQRSAERRNGDNITIACENGMTEEQAELIADLCALRHELHTNMRRVTIDDTDTQIKKRILSLNVKIKESGLSPMDFIPSSEDDFIDIDDLYAKENIDKEIGEQWPESGTQEYQDKWDEEYERIYAELEELNSNIERYLSEIDKTYKTTWCPTGALRNF